jgi:hypothetical protein
MELRWFTLTALALATLAGQAARSANEPAPAAPSAGETAPARDPRGPWRGRTVSPRVLVVNFDPVIEAEGGRRLHEVCRWNDPHTLTQGYIDDIRETSGGFASFRVVDWIDVDEFPLKKDGFCYTDESYLQAFRAKGGWHQPDAVDYPSLTRGFRMAERVERGEIDEVWVWSMPYSGFWESTMAGKGAYFCNSDPVPGIKTSRIFVIMGFNYERGVGEMLEDLGHRTESILRRVYGSWEPKPTHAWNRFTLYDKQAPGQAACGNVHFAPNSQSDYDWGNPTPVESTCDDWFYYPHLTGRKRTVTCAEWGSGDIRLHHQWWLNHLPRAPGRTAGKLNNWWAYVVDFNRYRESR